MGDDRRDDGIPVGTDSPVRQPRDPADRRTAAQELDDLAEWAAAWNAEASARWRKKHGGDA